MRYIPAFDGLRALAVFGVLAFHARVPGFGGGFLGVDLFFVLSGFLITSLLTDEFASTGTISLGRFYVRRLRRLYPALLAMLAVYLVVAPMAFDSRVVHWRDALLAALYLSDYSRAFWGVPSVLQHTWSLSVEEHFYLLWPLVLTCILRMPAGRRMPFVLLLVVLSMSWRWWALSEVNWSEVYCRFDTRLSGLLLGAALAFRKRPLHRLIPIVGIALLVVALMQAAWRMDAALGIWMLAAELGTGCLLLTGQQSRVLGSPIMVWLGKLSYGIYLWHYPVMYWMRGQSFGWEVTFLAGGGIAVIAAATSYYTIESYFRRGRVERAQVDGRLRANVLHVDPDAK